MKKKNKNLTITMSVEECGKCGTQMERRKHTEITQKQLSKPFYFSEWDYCTNKDCGMIQHYDKYKVYNNNDMSIYMQAKEEENNLISLMRKF